MGDEGRRTALETTPGRGWLRRSRPTTPTSSPATNRYGQARSHHSLRNPRRAVDRGDSRDRTGRRGSRRRRHRGRRGAAAAVRRLVGVHAQRTPVRARDRHGAPPLRPRSRSRSTTGRASSTPRRCSTPWRRPAPGATFFVLGRHVRAHPEIARRIVAEGHELASHGDDHSLLTFAGPAAIAHQFRAAEEAVTDAVAVVGRAPVPRAPRLPRAVPRPGGATAGLPHRRLDRLDLRYRPARRRGDRGPLRRRARAGRDPAPARRRRVGRGRRPLTDRRGAAADPRDRP